MTKVSFIIPTLNRVRYVGRAVASCVAAGECAGTPFEVVVLDSDSDDGSWEMLAERFGHDERVVLRQNRRGLGPTRSWLDGAAFITGDAVTFVWSDDYVADTMLLDLLPSIERGGDVAIGHAAIRDVNDDTPFPPATTATVFLDTQEIVRAYYGTSASISAPPFSPACALFSRRAFDRWRELVVAGKDEDTFTEQLMWRRAIGPDLLLFLVALDFQQGPVTFVGGTVVQFSAHPDSISISSPPWLLQAGYLTARVAALSWASLFRGYPRHQRAAMLTHTALHAVRLTRGVPRGVRGLEDMAAVTAIAKGYARSLFGMARREAGFLACSRAAAAIVLARLRRRNAGGTVSMAPDA